MKRILLVLILLLVLSAVNIHATLTRVNSLGDIENPVTGKISGLIKDDIVDIYFNPARVNDVNAFLILTSFHLKYGTDEENEPSDEKSDIIKTTGSKNDYINRTIINREAYNFNLNTGILIPMKVFNLFINYNPYWIRFKEKEIINNTTYDPATSSITNTIDETHKNSYNDRKIPFDITMGFNIKNKIMIGIRTGYFSSAYEESGININGLIIEKGEYELDRFILGAGVKFNFTKNISLSFASDMNFSQKDESPLKIEGVFAGAKGYNYNPLEKVYTYTTTENETSYSFRLIPEITLKGTNEKFIRIIAEVNYIDYAKDFHFNEQGDLKNCEKIDFTKNKLIGNLGGSYNHSLSKSTKAVYGIKYIGIINGINKYKFYENKNDKTQYKDYREEIYDNFIGLFTGFDIEVAKYIFVRTGISQGLYRLKVSKTFDTDVTGNQKSTKENSFLNEYYLPNTDFTLGFYIQPVTDFIIEFNFSGSKDWCFSNFSYYNEKKLDNGSEIYSKSTRNFDYNIGMSICYKI